jgi:hypothetical protein
MSEEFGRYGNPLGKNVLSHVTISRDDGNGWMLTLIIWCENERSIRGSKVAHSDCGVYWKGLCLGDFTWKGRIVTCNDYTTSLFGCRELKGFAVALS